MLKKSYLLASNCGQSLLGQYRDVLFEQAMFAERGSLKELASFIGKLHKLMLSLTK